jgi:ribonuclease PH
MTYKRERKNDEIRQTKITKDYLLYAHGSVLIETGKTKVICTAMVEESVPRFLRGQGTGWVTAEYAMLPGATQKRFRRERTRSNISGRTQEIQRLIGRSLRAIIDLDRLGERTIWIDCDVIQADGGTRTASITGAYIALSNAIERLILEGKLEKNPITDYLAATSAGIVNGETLLDLCYEEDSNADVDMNVVMTGTGKFVEIQGTAEESTFTREELNEFLILAEKGINDLIIVQKNYTKEIIGD